MNKNRHFTRVFLPPLVTMLLLGGAIGDARADETKDKKAADAAVLDRLERQLSAYEFLPSRQALLGIHPQVDQLLRRLVERPGRRALARTRAITVLRLFPSPATRTTLERVIRRGRKAVKKPGLAMLNLGQALGSYAVVAGPASLDLLRPFLSHKLLDLRLAAARAVRLSKSPRALELLRRLEAGDPSSTVRAEAAQEIKRLLSSSRER